MYYKDLLGSISRVGYRIPVKDFYLVPHGLRCQKNTLWITQSMIRRMHEHADKQWIYHLYNMRFKRLTYPCNDSLTSRECVKNA